jgi:hypothetical protein
MNGKGKLLFLGLGFLISAAAAEPPPEIAILSAEAKLDYPVEITFALEAESDAEIRTVELEYGLIERDCTPDINLAIPDDFSPDSRIDVEWAWRVAASGNLPPGTKIWWSWHLVDAEGNEIRSEKQWVTWIDSKHDWKDLVSENIILHWYWGSEEYNRDFLSAAESAREILRNDIGSWPEAEINIYIYGSNQDLLEALARSADWIGGLSFGRNQRTIMIGVDHNNEELAKAYITSTVSHELAHTAVDSIMGGCYASIPLWLNEGIAMTAEGELDAVFTKVLDEAVYYDTLFSLRSMSYDYQYIDGDPTLTYAESYSATQYVIGQYGREQIRSLLIQFGEGYTYDFALRDAFGVDMDELEEAWRAAIGADPMPERILQETPAAPPTALPPSSQSLVISTLTPTPRMPPTGTPTSTPSTLDLRTVAENPWNVAALCGCSLLCGLGLAGSLSLLLLRGKRAASAGRGGG